MGRKSFSEVYIHLVWRTKYSRRILGGELEIFVHQRIREIGCEFKLTPLAVGSAWDHVHAYFRWRLNAAISDVVGAMKSKIAVEWNNSRRDGRRKGDKLRWQVGFGAVSTRRSDVRVVQNYVDTQKQRHRRHRVWEPFERVEFLETPYSSDNVATDETLVCGRVGAIGRADTCRKVSRRCDESMEAPIAVCPS
jgi:REP element-mobilizing transposase RayT